MTKFILSSVMLCLLTWLLKTEIKIAIEALFSIVFIVFQTIEFSLNDLKQRTRIGPPFNISLSRNLIGLAWYGILLCLMIAAIIGNYSLLKARLEAIMPFEIGGDNQFLGLSGIIAILITFAEIVISWLLLEGWSNPEFLRTDIDPIKSERSYSFVRALSILPWVMFFFILGVDIVINYHGTYVLTKSALSSTIMALLTTILSMVFSLISFFCIMPLFIMKIALLRHILSFLIECLAFIVFLIHGLLTNIMRFLISSIEILAKIGETISKPFKRLNNQWQVEKLPVPAKIIIALLLIGLLSFAWSYQKLTISKKCIVVLLDLTGSFGYFSESSKHVDNVIKELMPGDEIYILSITETSFYDKNILFKASMPLPKYTNELYSDVYRADIDSIRAEYSHGWKEVVTNLKTNAKKTDVMGGIGYATLVFNSSQLNHRYLLIFSDLEDNVLENCDTRLDGVKVWCLYVEHSDFERYKEKENFWRQYFRKAGVKEEEIIIKIPAQSPGIKIK